MQDGHTFEILRKAQIVDISDLVSYGVVEFDGFGMPIVRRLTQRGPLQNGDTDVGFRLDPRVLRLLVLAYAGDDAAIIAARAALIGLLKPGSDVVSLRWTYDGVSRQIDTHYAGGMTLPSLDWKLQHHRMGFELRAADPTWYDPEGTTVGFAQTGGGTGMPMPFVFPMTLGASDLDVTQAIDLNHANSWNTYPTITVTGPVTNLVITNGATEDKIDFTGFTIGAGVTYTIDLRYGYKTVVDHLGANQISKLSTDSDLATWGLIAGENSIGVVGTSITSATLISFQFNERFIGV
jgi:hypothetical protein